MPNSYIYNEERSFDGESMNDWFSGSGSVLVKLLIGGVFGVRPSLDEVIIRPSSYMPCASVTLTLKGAKVDLVYKKTGNAQRQYFVDGKEVRTDERGLVLTQENLRNKIKIEVID